MFDALFHFFNGPSPVHPKVWKGRLTPLNFRPYRDSDFDRCIELHRLNEPGRFPEDSRGLYEETLRKGDSYTLVGERGGEIVCAGGIHCVNQKDWTVLCYGLVDPKFQKQGIGTAMTLARLSLLDPKVPRHLVFILAVEKSIGFYRRMGFQDAPPWEDKHGKKHPSASLIFSYHEIHRAGKILRQQRITVPEHPVSLPLFKVPEQATM